MKHIFSIGMSRKQNYPATKSENNNNENNLNKYCPHIQQLIAKLCVGIFAFRMTHGVPVTSVNDSERSAMI